jgi:response regulator RpfG family c-di-GMP phosphodiesterase
MNWLEIFIAIGGTAGITSILTLQIQRRKEKASAGQEEAKEKQEVVKSKKDLADLEREIYERIVATMQQQFDSQSKEIETLKWTQKDLIATIEIQKGNIEHLQKTVNEYKETCDTCQFRQEKITLKKIK